MTGTPTKGIVPTYPSYTAANDFNAVFLEPLINSVPDQAAPDYGSARTRIVGHLGELPGVDVDSLCRRESGIRSVTTARNLEH